MIITQLRVHNIQDTIQYYSTYKVQENVTNFQEKRQSTDANAEMTQMLVLLDKDLKQITMLV